MSSWGWFSSHPYFCHFRSARIFCRALNVTTRPSHPPGTIFPEFIDDPINVFLLKIFFLLFFLCSSSREVQSPVSPFNLADLLSPKMEQVYSGISLSSTWLLQPLRRALIPQYLWMKMRSSAAFSGARFLRSTSCWSSLFYVNASRSGASALFMELRWMPMSPKRSCRVGIGWNRRSLSRWRRAGSWRTRDRTERSEGSRSSNGKEYSQLLLCNLLLLPRWAQSFLVGTQEVLCGWRDDNGMVPLVPRQGKKSLYPSISRCGTWRASR